MYRSCEIFMSEKRDDEQKMWKESMIKCLYVILIFEHDPGIAREYEIKHSSVINQDYRTSAEVIVTEVQTQRRRKEKNKGEEEEEEKRKKKKISTIIELSKFKQAE